MRAEQFNDLEQEAIVLLAAWDMLSGLVNYSFFKKLKRTTDVLLLFANANDRRLFNILLGDFLSQPNERGGNKSYLSLPQPPKAGRPTDYTFLFYLRQICASPHLGTQVECITKPLDALSPWLEDECLVEKVWFGEIDVEADIRIERIRYIKICGDIAKHNFSRLQSNVEKIIQTLRKSGVEIDAEAGFKALPGFYEWFHENIFVYHSSHIAQMLNDLLWGIYLYLTPEFQRSYQEGPRDLAYSYQYPAGCNHSFARSAYWSLMNHVRRGPYLPRFAVDPSLKSEY
ncbi:hypothetical protein [Paraburkholderia sp. HD33-4]|uniref:hypothetical protein n=1 Tax=Paraburkholderia sp. HD33-4 TaxID=2883242 RepID=UPI001F1E1B4B|nr:hypothetical protein [Paraburkholderia sp. HD33-4]